MRDFQGVAVNLLQQMHYADHLAPISVMMDVPMLFVDPDEEEACKRYYPDITTISIDFADFSPEYLIANYNTFFMSDLWDRDVLKEKFAPLEKRYGKRVRNVHVPHGFSDKGYYLLKSAREDITLIYGQNMLDLIASEGYLQELQSYVICGNYRYTYYKMHEEYFDNLVNEEVLSRFAKQQTTIIYAPTWLDIEESTSFFDGADAILANLPDNYNLIVKLHPRLEEDDTVRYYQITGKYEGRNNITFVSNFPVIYPLLKHSDIYIGDMSSIGYDYLVFNRPMFFLNKEQRNPKMDRRALLYLCGIPIVPDQYSNIYTHMEANLSTDAERFSSVREQMYTYTFGASLPFSTIRDNILTACATEPKWHAKRPIEKTD